MKWLSSTRKYSYFKVFVSFLQGTLQQFVDRLFHTVFMRYRRGGSSLPPVVKFLFDLLDAQAKELNLTDPEVLHTWKNNRY